MKIAELAEVLVRSRQSLWVLRAASCGADTCPAPDVGTALRMIHAAVNGLLEIEGELRERSTRSFTPVPRGDLPGDRASVERLAAKCLLEVEEMQRNVAFIVRDMSEAIDATEVQRLAAASASVQRAVSALRFAVEAALLTLPVVD